MADSPVEDPVAAEESLRAIAHSRGVEADEAVRLAERVCELGHSPAEALQLVAAHLSTGQSLAEVEQQFPNLPAA